MMTLLVKCKENDDLLNLNLFKLFLWSLPDWLLYSTISSRLLFPGERSTQPSFSSFWSKHSTWQHSQSEHACAFSRNTFWPGMSVRSCHPLVAKLKSCIPNLEPFELKMTHSVPQCSILISKILYSQLLSQEDNGKLCINPNASRCICAVVSNILLAPCWVLYSQLLT